jgi:hypothetical protein
MKRLLYIFIAFTGLMIACNIDQRGGSKVSEILSYTVTSRDQNLFVLTKSACSAFIKSQQVELELTIEGKSSEMIPQLWELSGSEGTRNLPVNFSVTSSQVDGQEISLVKLSFRPVHQRRLFQETGLRGDIEGKYLLTMYAGPNEKFDQQILVLETDLPRYRESIAVFGLQATTTPYYVSGLGNTIPSADKTIVNAAIKNDSEPRVTGNEILANGFWIKFSAYHQHDSLYINFRVVNQSSGTVSIALDQLVISTESAIQKPFFIMPNPIVQMRNGGRNEFTISFPLARSVKYELDLSGIKLVDQHGVSIFKNSVIFTSSNILNPS